MTLNESFKSQLLDYKARIDADLDVYATSLVAQTRDKFGDYPAEAVKAYASLLTRGGKRIRGALTMVSYEMLGGQDEQVALKAARIIEMLHAYILMADDIQDRSATRRSAPTAHEYLKNYHISKGLKGDSQHFGSSIAIDGFLFGLHQAINEIVDLPVAAEVRLSAIKNVNSHFITTIHGQSKDIFNEVVDRVEKADIENVLQWKTAYYTFLNPLQFGAILAGTSDDLSKLEDYSLNAGRAFQITDDVLGMFGDPEESGKSPMDDIKEGKRTILTAMAGNLVNESDSEFLNAMLGKSDLSAAEFSRCQQIIRESGALARAEASAQESAEAAAKAVDSMPSDWNSDSKNFLKSLTQFIATRTA